MDVLKQPWFLLGQPWCHSEDAGTGVLAGSDDPHVATPVIDCDDLRYLWEESDDTDDDMAEVERKCKEQARAIASHIVDLHNASLNTTDTEKR